MSIRIGSNISSMLAQRRLSQRSDDLSQIFERLSSGLRINRASDDAAGLSIATGLNANARVYAQAIRNANDGISFLQIQDAAITELKSIVTRVKELAEQAANGVYSNVQRAALDTEAQALRQEYSRILSTTEFNDRNVFDRNENELSIQLGYGSQSRITSTLSSARAESIDDLQYINSTSANGNSQYASASADGRFVVFTSTASNLVAGDSNGVADIFVKDMATGTISLVSKRADGTLGNGAASEAAAISADGRYVTFSTAASNLAASDANGANQDIFRKDLLTGELLHVSTSSAGVGGDNVTTRPTISADGRYIAFESFATNLVSGDWNVRWDVFVKDVETGAVIRASTDSAGVQYFQQSGTASISSDGSFVVFVSGSTLVAGDTNGLNDIFKKNLLTGETTRINTSSSGTQANGDTGSITVSEDGRYAQFYSDANNLVAGDTNGATDVFRKNLVTGEVILVSTASSGTVGNAASFNYLNFPTISEDGRFSVFYSLATNLETNDANATFDVFIKDNSTGRTALLSRTELGSSSNNQSVFPRISADGDFILFEALSSNLASGDSNGFWDVFKMANPLLYEEESSLARLTYINLESQYGAQQSLDWIDSYLEELNTAQGQVGAMSTRLQFAISNLQSLRENSLAAESRIMDVDIAQETANLVRTQILQQAAVAILAQANLQPALAIQLLKGRAE